MKTFSTHGTGNQQTLSPIESDMMPIYETMQSAETDLANLEEGQLVGIEDTGDELAHPVDAVEVDNLHAVTSNAVAEAISYSTTEQETGGKWIDGKPIYRRAFDILLSSSVESTTISSQLNTSNIIPIRMDGIIKNDLDRNYLTNGYGDGVSIGLSSGGFYVTSGYSFNRVIAVIEYTKIN